MSVIEVKYTLGDRVEVWAAGEWLLGCVSAIVLTADVEPAYDVSLAVGATSTFTADEMRPASSARLGVGPPLEVGDMFYGGDPRSDDLPLRAVVIDGGPYQDAWIHRDDGVWQATGPTREGPLPDAYRYVVVYLPGGEA